MSPTRRAVLQGAVPVALGLAGCVSSDGADGDGNGDGPPRDDERERASVENSGSVQDPPVVKPRNPEGDRVLEPPEEDTGLGILVGSRERATALEFRPGVPAEDVAATRDFLAGTDFDEQTVYVRQGWIRSCYRYRIRAVTWRPRDIEYEYCRELRPPDARCEADTRVAVAFVFRLPAVVDTEIRSGGASGRSPCAATDTEWAVIEGGSATNATVPADATAAENATADTTEGGQ